MKKEWTEMGDQELTDLCCAVSHSKRMQYVAREVRHELLTRRAADLTDEESSLLVALRHFLTEHIDGGADTCGEHRQQRAVLDRLLGAKP